MNKIAFILIGSSFGLNSSAQNVNEIIKTGNDFYKQQEYLKADLEYIKALEVEPANLTAKFNHANALFRQDKKVEAAVLFNDLAATAKDKSMLSKAWYNKGVILSNQKNLEESIEAYKNALRNNPDDKDARENLQKAMLELKKKVMIVDEDSGAVKTLTDVLTTKGYEVTESIEKELVEKAIANQPDIIIINSALSGKHDIVQTLRFEKGLENVLFVVYQ